MRELIGICLILIGFIVGSVWSLPMDKYEKISACFLLSAIIVTISVGVYLLGGQT